MKKPTLILYVTDDCTLCDAALDLLVNFQHQSAVLLETIDIAFRDELFERLGERIPVVSNGLTELDWPFTEDDVADLLKEHS